LSWRPALARKSTISKDAIDEYIELDDKWRMDSALRAMRRQKGLTQAELARALGVTQSVISDLENGGSCRLDVAARLEEWSDGLITPAVLIADQLRFKACDGVSSGET
jgi:DNA-binding XRE family transcriptional regulator